MVVSRKFVDCRTVPSEKNCSLYLAGTEEEVMLVAVRHAVEEQVTPTRPSSAT